MSAPPAAIVHGRRVIAPYVTAWSEERELPSVVVEVPGSGIGFEDETPGDRDGRGVLWQRTRWLQNAGRPEFGQLHPARQQRVMRRLLCQVCAGPADRRDDGMLWLLQNHREGWSDWPEGVRVTEPPMCADCVLLSVRVCPALKGGTVLVRARSYPLAGVFGALYSGGGSPAVVGEATVSFGSAALPWVRATSLVRELRGCTLLGVGSL